MITAKLVTKIFNWFYIAPIKRVISQQTFLYAACGGSNQALNWVLYFVLYNFVLQKQNMNIGFASIPAETATAWITIPIIFCTGFWLNKNIAFTRSVLKTRTQIVRYAISVSGSIILTHLGILFFVKIVGIYPTPSYMITSCLTVIYSYLMQKYFTFTEREPQN